MVLENICFECRPCDSGKILLMFADILNQGNCSVSVRTAVFKCRPHVENDRSDLMDIHHEK